jgi:hypothetical protein
MKVKEYILLEIRQDLRDDLRVLLSHQTINILMYRDIINTLTIINGLICKERQKTKTG